MARFRRREYQKLITAFILKHKRCNIWATMGSGKTGATMWALNKMFQTGILSSQEDRVLVLAPLRVASGTWPPEQEKWRFPALLVVDGTGPEKARIAALESDANVVCVNYDVVEWLVEYCGDEWPFTVVVADESTKLKGYRSKQGSKRARALAAIAHKHVKRWINLTGTPAPNGLKDLWGQTWFVDGGERLGSSYKAFTDRWFISKPAKPGSFTMQHAPLKNSEKEIQQRLSDVSLTVDAAEYFGCDKPIYTPVVVDLPKKARKIYDQFEAELFAELESGTVEAANAASKTIKCLQLASGAVYKVDEDGERTDEWVKIHDAKLDALESIVEELNGAPLLVAYQYKHDLARLKKKFPHGVAMGKGKQGNKDMEAWNRGEIPIMFAHPASAGHGLNLQDGGHHLAIFSDTWNYEHFAQIVERIGPVRQMQAGHPRPVFVYIIQARGTLDELVAERRDSKRDIQDDLMEYMKAKKARK